MLNNIRIYINRKNLIIFTLLIFLVSLSQVIIGKKIFEMGFFTDDWLFLSAYRSHVMNPFLDILQAWKNIGSHNFSYSYYIGILHNFFGLDYLSYRITNQIIKILATLSLYPLIFYISKRKLLAFLSTIIFGMHFSSFGLLDGPSRGGNFIAIGLMNLFLLAYYYVCEKRKFNIFIMLSFSVWLFIIILFGSTRLFPLILIVPLVELLNLIRFRSGIKQILQRLLVIYSPLLLLLILSPSAIIYQVSYIGGLFEWLKLGNLQLFLTPFAATGSMYIPRDFWPVFGNPMYDNLSAYLLALLVQFLLMYFILLIFIVFLISKKPIKFLIRNLIINFLIGIVVYMIVHNWLFLDVKTRTPVDPGTFLIPALIGISFLITCFCSFLEWKESKKKNNLLLFFFLGPVFSFLFILLTWFFADVNSIFMSVHAYLSIPSIGVSVSLAAILMLLYEKLKLMHKIIPISIIIVILFSYFKINEGIVNKFYSNWVDNGLSISDQQRIINQFWAEIDSSNKFNQFNLPLIYLDTEKTKYEDSAFYNEAIVWKLTSWFDLKYKGNKEVSFSSCAFIILGKSDFDRYVVIGDDGKTIIYNKCGRFEYKPENFYAFSLEDRNLIPERKQVLQKLGIE